MLWDRTNRPVWLRCAVGVLLAVIAAAIRLQFLEILGLRATFLTFYPAVVVAALYGGFSAGLPATAVSSVLADYFWIEPVGRLAITDSADLMSLVVFLASGALISYLAEAAYRAQARAHKAEEQSRLGAERKHAEEELRESQSRLDLALRSAQMGVWRLDLIESKRHFDDQVCHLMGIDPAKFTGTEEEFYKAVHPGDREMLKAIWTRTIELGAHYEAEYRTVWPDGSIHYITARGKMVHDDSGRPVRVNGLIWDVTDRKRVDETLRASEEHYRSLFDNMLNGYAYCKMQFEQDLPIDFTYLDVNGAFETLTGLRDVVGRKVSEVIPGMRQSDPELLELYGRVALTGIPERFETYIESLGMWFSVSAYSPRKEHFVAVFDVITERKGIEAALQLSESRFRLLSGTAGRLLASQNPQAIVKELCRQVMEHLDCHVFFNFLVDETMGKLHLNACAGIPEEEARKIEWLDYGVAVCGCAARDGKRIVAEDIFNTPDIRTELGKVLWNSGIRLPSFGGPRQAHRHPLLRDEDKDALLGRGPGSHEDGGRPGCYRHGEITSHR